MLLEREDAKKLVKVLAKKMLERRSLPEWRKLAYETNDISCGDPYSAGSERLSGADYTRALNRMHFAVNGVKPYAEGGGGGGGDRLTDKEESKNPCWQICLDPTGYGCGPDTHLCQGDEFTCGYFTCNPGVTGGNDCYASFFKCTQSFTCTSFDDTDGDCYYFTCPEPSPYHRCTTQPF